MLNKKIIFIIVMLSLINVIYAEQEVKTIKFFGGYIPITEDLKIYNKTIEINPLDGLSSIIYAKASIRGDIFNANTKIYVHTNGNFCTPDYYSVPISNNYLMNFDCTNQITSGGNYTVGFMTTKSVNNIYGEWEITYLNNPKGSFDFFGTEYWFGENGTIFLQLKDDNSLPVNTGSCDATIYYPDKVKWISNFPMKYLNNSQGLYYLDFSVPQIFGVYMVEAKCEYNNLFLRYNPIQISYDGTLVGNPSLSTISVTDCIFYETSATTYQSVFFNISNINKNNITRLKPVWVGITAKTSQFEIYNYNTSSWNILVSGIVASNNIICPARQYISGQITQNITQYISPSGIVNTRITSASTGHYTDEFRLELSLNTPQIIDIKGSSEINVHNPDITRNIDIILNNLNSIIQNQTYWFPILNNTQNIMYDKLIEIQSNVSMNYGKLINISQQLSDHNSSVWNQLSDIINRLNVINQTTWNILNNITSDIVPRLDSMNIIINGINQSSNILKDKINCVAPTDSDTCYRLNLIQAYTINLENDISSLKESLKNHNLTVQSQLDDIINTINIININTDSLKEGQDNITNSLNILYNNITTILTNLGVPFGSTLWGKLTSIETLSNQINTSINIIKTNIDNSQILIQDVKDLVACTNSSTGTVCNKMNSLSTNINNLQMIMEQNHSTIYNKLIETFNNVTNTYNKVEDVINYLNCNTQTTNSVCWRLIDIKERINEINITTNNILNNITLIIVPKLNTIDTNTVQIKDYVDTLEDELNCTNPIDSDVCYMLNLIQGYTNDIESNLSSLSIQLTNHDIDIKARIDSIENNIILIYNDTQNIFAKSGLTEAQNTTLYAIKILVEDNQYLINKINSTITSIESMQSGNFSLILNSLIEISMNQTYWFSLLNNNQTKIYDKLIEIQNNVTSNYNELIIFSHQLIYFNATTYTQLTHMINNLAEINQTILKILTDITDNVIPKLNTMNTIINTITNYTDTLEDELNCVSPTAYDICYRLNLIEGYTTNLETNISILISNLESHNATVYDQLNNIITTINVINSNTINLGEGQDNILNSLSQLQNNITTILIRLGVPSDSTLWGKLTTLESLTSQINSTINIINTNSNEIKTLITDVIKLVDCTNSSTGTVCNKMNSLSTNINNLQMIMEQNHSTIYNKLIETFNNVTNTYNKVEDVINYLNCNTQTTNSVCWRLIDIKNRLNEINITTNNILNNITLIIVPKLNTIDTNTVQIKDYVDTLESSFNCTSFNVNSVCYRLNLIQNYTNNVRNDISNLSIQLTNHNSSITQRLNNIDSRLFLIYNDTQYIRVQNFSGGGGGGLTIAQNTTLYAIQTLTQNNQNLLLSINQTVNEIKTIQSTELVTGALQIKHSTISEYRRGEVGSSVVLVVLNEVPVSGVTIKGDYYYPNQSLWIDDATFTEIGTTGVYYYNFTVPITSPEGVYKAKITAEQSTSGSSAEDDFDDGNADGWYTTGATWIVTDEGEPQNYVYKKTDWGGFIFAYSTSIGIQTDFTYTAKVRVDGYQGYDGVTFRYIDSGNNYIVYFRQGAGNIRLMKHTNGGTSTLAETPYYSMTINTNQWYNWTVVAEGGHFLIYVDDYLWIDYTDIGAIHEQGYIGAFAYNSIGSWDDIYVTASGTADYAYSMIDFKIDDTVINAISEVNTTVNENQIILTYINTTTDNTNNIVSNINSSIYDINLSINGLISSVAQLNSDFSIILSDFPEIVAGNYYRAQLNVFNSTGKKANLSALPTITIYDALREIIVNEASFDYFDTGIYNYSYKTLSSAIGGLWESVVTANYNGEIVKLNDYWRISSSPADVVINDIIDDTVPTIVADVDIENKGESASDFTIVYCIVAEENNLCGGDDDVDYQSVTRYILAGQTLNQDLQLEVPTNSQYYFKVKAKALSEVNWAGASKQFTAVPYSEQGAIGIGSTTKVASIFTFVKFKGRYIHKEIIYLSEMTMKFYTYVIEFNEFDNVTFHFSRDNVTWQSSPMIPNNEQQYFYLQFPTSDGYFPFYYYVTAIRDGVKIETPVYSEITPKIFPNSDIVTIIVIILLLIIVQRRQKYRDNKK